MAMDFGRIRCHGPSARAGFVALATDRTRLRNKAQPPDRPPLHGDSIILQPNATFDDWRRRRAHLAGCASSQRMERRRLFGIDRSRRGSAVASAYGPGMPALVPKLYPEIRSDGSL